MKIHGGHVTRDFERGHTSKREREVMSQCRARRNHVTSQWRLYNATFVGFTCFERKRERKWLNIAYSPHRERF